MSDAVPAGRTPIRPAPVPPTLPPRLHERFALGELIGRGTCSEVYRARDLLLDRDAAVKVFPVADDPRTRREVSLLASMDHPSLVAVYDVGEVDGRAFVVMTLLEGGSLTDRLAAGPLAVAETLLAVAAVADGLGHVHRAGVLHRDVTPRSVLFDVDGRAHLSDFGVAFVADAPRITDTGIVVGSAPYLAPEQVRGDDVGPAADVYALGLVMIEALTARPAYVGAPLEAAHARLEHRPEMPAGLGADVAALLAGMTADDPADRPGADQVCVGLRRAALAAETSATIVPVAPLAGVGPVCAVPAEGGSAEPAAGTAVAAVGLPRAVPAPRPAAAGPDETPRVDPRRGLVTANARGMVVVGSVVASVLLAGGVVFASAWTVDSVSSTAPPPSATVPPPTAEVAQAPEGVAGPSEGSSDAESGSDGDSGSSGASERSRDAEVTDGGSDRAVSADLPGTDEARPPASSAPGPTTVTTPAPRSTSTPPTPSSGTTTPSPTSTTSSTTPGPAEPLTGVTTVPGRALDALDPALRALLVDTLGLTG